MNPFLWYMLVMVDISLLIFSVIKRNLIISLGALVLVLVLNKYKNSIPLPKYFSKMKVINVKSKLNQCKSYSKK